MDMLKILILEDSPYDVELVQYELKKGGIDFITKVVDTRVDFIKELDGFKPDVILSDHSMPQFNSIEALRIYKESKLTIPFILVTGSVSEEFAVQAILSGASDYLLKTNLTRLPSAVNNALSSWRAVQEKEKAKKEVKQTNVFLNQIMDSQPIVFYVSKVSNECEISYISKNVKNITGYPAQHFLGNPKLWRDNIHPDEVEIVCQFIKGTIPEGSGNYEYRWKCADGAYKWFLDNFTVVKDDKGQEFMHGSRIDITKLKNADLRKSVFSEGVNEMLFMISHKVRHSVAQIRGLFDLIQDEIITEQEIKRVVGYMKEPTDSLDLYTKELTNLMDDLKKRNNHLQ